MTLPHGFGSSREPRELPPSRCKLSNRCGGYGSDKCKIHHWIYRHDEAWLGLKIISMFLIVIMGVVIGFSYDWNVNILPARADINNLNCGQLAEYVADKSYEYDYAEHRYEWLCVNEQIKEFQG